MRSTSQEDTAMHCLVQNIERYYYKPHILMEFIWEEFKKLLLEYRFILTVGPGYVGLIWLVPMPPWAPLQAKGRVYPPDHCDVQTPSAGEKQLWNINTKPTFRWRTSQKGRFVTILSFPKTTLGESHLAQGTRTLQTQLNVVSAHWRGCHSFNTW